MPSFQSYPYMEPPSFVVPHTHHHLMDYRRMLNPQYYQTMAYQSRRFRYQHNSQTREMTNSEVQTEPLSGTQRTSPPSSTQLESSSIFPVSSHTPSPPSSQLISPTVAVQKNDHPAELKNLMPSTSPPTTRAPANGSFVIQTEEVRIECCTTPVGMQLLHSHETTGVSRSFSQELVQCSSVLQDHVADNASSIPEEQSEQGLRACPDILLVGTPKNGEKFPPLEEEPTGRFYSRDVPCSKKDVTATPKTAQRAIQLPFNPKYLDELRKMESTVWSAEETLIPSSESFIKNDFTDSYDERLADEIPIDGPQIRGELPTKGNGLHATDVPPCVLSEAVNRVLVDAPGTVEANPAKAAESYSVMLENPPQLEEENQDKNDIGIQDHQDSSFESLPAYLPSASWLADFESARYRSRFSPTMQQQSRPLTRHDLELPSRRRKLDLECKEHTMGRLPKERCNPKGKADRRSLSDHECCLRRNYYRENSFTPGPKRDRLCTRCLAKQTVYASPNPGLESRTLKRKAVPFQQRNDTPLPTCDACVRHSKKIPTQGSCPDVGGGCHGRHAEAESSENGSSCAGTNCPGKIRRPNDLKRPLASKQNLVTHPSCTYPKLREKNCVCNKLPCQSVTRERLSCCPHGNAIQEMDENCAVPLLIQDKWKHVDPLYYRCQRGQKFVFLHYWTRVCFSFLT